MSFKPTFPGNWRVVSLQELTDGSAITYGVVQPGAIVNVGVPMLRVNNFRGFGLDTSEVLRIDSEVESKYGRTRLRANDVLTTIVGSVGQVAVVPQSMQGWNIARAVALVRPRDAGMAYWIALCLRSPAAQHALGIAANTTVQITVNLKDLRTLQVPLPPPGERREITETIRALDDQIDLLRQTNATLESIAQTIFKSWFIDFDPVHAKSKGLPPVGMDEATAALFPDSFEESVLGAIPRGWQVGSIGNFMFEVSERAKGRTLEVLSAVQTGELVRSVDHFTKKVFSEDISKYKVVDQICFAYNPSRINIGSIGLNETGAPGAVSPIYVVLRPRQSNDAYFVLHHLRTKSFKNQIESLSSGSVRQSLSSRDFLSICLALPDSRILSIFIGIRSALFDSIASNRNEIKTLEELRDTLLPRLISGKLSIPEVEEVIEESIGAVAA